MKEKIYSLNDLMEIVNALLQGNSRVANVLEMVRIFDRYNYSVEKVENDCFRLNRK